MPKNGTLCNFTKHLHQNPPEPHKVSAPSIFSAKNLRNLTRSLHRNLPEPHKVQYLLPEPPEPHHASSPRPSGTSSGSCTGNFGNLTRYLRQNPLEPNQVSAP